MSGAAPCRGGGVAALDIGAGAAQFPPMRLAVLIPLLLALVVGFGPAGAEAAPSAHGGAAHGSETAPCGPDRPAGEAAAPCEASCVAASCGICREAAGAVQAGPGREASARGPAGPPGAGRDEAPEPAPPKRPGRA